MGNQILIANPIKFDTDPPPHSHVRRLEECLWPGTYQHFLRAGSRGYPNGDMPVTVVIIREHRVHLLMNEESRFAVRKLLGRTWETSTNPSHAPQLFFAVGGRS